ncbi:hypothetical protein MLD38_005796 [Melastoma candidum]|uniref:Uncharacterized protein n=1 Tax=Melastoma candidum TaxID=119954 RepID=A0ACB9RKK0_9MYRT|nr:hypothetical protein MLD38_005796 [Melastoma candidum]
MIGSLQYLTLTRPDIAFVVNQLSQFLRSPTEEHVQAAKRILRYLCGMTSVGLPILSTDTSKLMTYAELTGRLPLYEALNNRLCNLSRFNTHFLEVQERTNGFTKLNRSRVLGYCLRRCRSYNPIQHTRTKHISIDYHFVQEQVRRGALLTKYVSTKEQFADIFTKNLNSPSFLAQRLNLTLRPEHEIAAR